MRDAYAQQLELLQGQLQQTTLQEPDWRELSGQYSADELFLMKAEFDKQKDNLAKVEAERQRVAQQQAAEQQQQMQEHLARQRVEMLERIPAWRDEDRRTLSVLRLSSMLKRRLGSRNRKSHRHLMPERLNCSTRRGNGTNFREDPRHPQEGSQSP